MVDSNVVEVPAVTCPLSTELTDELRQVIDPMRESDYLAVDTFLDTLEAVQLRVNSL